MTWITEFNGVFFLSIATILTGSFGLAVKYCLKSKCEHFSVCFGLLKIDRRVDLETQEEIKALELGIKEPDEEKADLPNVDVSQLSKKK
jgi:hypothetical protein